MGRHAVTVLPSVVIGGRQDACWNDTWLNVPVLAIYCTAAWGSVSVVCDQPGIVMLAGVPAPSLSQASTYGPICISTAMALTGTVAITV